MKTALTFLLAIFLFVPFAFSQQVTKIDESQVDKKMVAFTQKFATDFLNDGKTGKTYQFGDEATDAMKNALTEDQQKTIYASLKNQFGDFVSMEYADAWTLTGSATYTIYRFKGKFNKSDSPLAVTVALDDKGKIAGFHIKQWSDSLN